MPGAAERFGRIVLEDRVVVGTIRYGATIERIDVAEEVVGPERTFESDPRTERAAPHADLPWIVPGFVDVHVHGGGGADVMDGADAVRTMARAHLARGTTTLCPTTMTAPWEAVLTALDGVAQVMRDDDPALPHLPGAHLEGPFLSPDRLGAQPDAAQRPDAAKIERIVVGGVAAIVTMAPEIDGATEAAARLAEAGIRVSAGHTRADADTTEAFYDVVARHGGVAGATHLFNAMGGVAGREPGVAGVALARPEVFAELICDGVHLARATVLAALRAKDPRAMLVTDAIGAAGTAAERTRVGGREAVVAEGAVRLPDGTLAGSVLTMDRALRTLIGYGVPVPTAVRAASTAPARYLGMADRGVLKMGSRADLVVLDPTGSVTEVIRSGRTVSGAA